MREFADLDRAYDGFYNPTFVIDIDGGATLSPAQGRVSSVKVSTSIEKANRATFSVGGVYDQQQSDFTGLEDTGLAIGKGVTVKLGYGEAEETLMVGEITDLKPTFPEGSAPTVDVVAHDFRYAMNQGASDDSWSKSAITAATTAILNSYGFRGVKVDPGGPASVLAMAFQLKQIVKEAESDREFLEKLADRFDYEMFSRAGVLWFKRPSKTESPVVSLTYGRGLRSFETTGRSDNSDVGTVKHKGINHYTGEVVSGTADRSGSDGEELLRKAAMESATEATRRSEAAVTDIERDEQSTATTLGLPDLQIGEWVELSGLGSIGEESFDGTYYVLSADHAVRESGYTTTATLTGPR